MDSDVKTFASSTLPTLQEHLKSAEELQGSTRGRSADTKTSGASSDAGSTSKASDSMLSRRARATRRPRNSFCLGVVKPGCAFERTLFYVLH